jgi:hypothetical protein
MHFKETGESADYYKNIGIEVSNVDGDTSPAVNDEINRVEEIIYRKLLELAGEHDVIRGER